MRVVTWNIHSAIGLDGVTSVGRIASVIEDLEPDVVGLNEVRATLRDNHAKRLAELLGMAAAFQRNLVRPTFRFGNAVLTRGAILGVRDVALPSTAEQRGLLLADIDLDGEVLTFGSLHLGLKAAEQARQKDAVLAALPAGEGVIVAGDCNAFAKNMQPVAGRLRVAEPVPSFPAAAPKSAIDLVFHGARWRVERAFTVATTASDHVPVVVDFARVG